MIRVEYGCDCGRLFEIEKQYYCQSCQALRCPICIVQEIDSFYCPQCLENMASSESISFFNSCKKCFECPVCRGTINFIGQTSTESENSTIYFMSCTFCRWDSLSLSLSSDSPNSLIAKLIAKEKEDALQKEITKLIEKFQKEEREKAKEKRQMTRLRRSSFVSRAAPLPALRPPPMSLADLEKTLAAKDNKRNHLKKPNEEKKDEKQTSSNEGDDGVVEEVIPDVTDIFKVSSLQQRLSNLLLHSNTQTSISELYPKRKHLMCRRSKRCYKCDKVLIKPDLSPNKIEFKRQHVALFYVPKVTIVKLPSIALEQEAVLLIRITNPVHSLTHLQFSPLPNAKDTATVTLPTQPTFVAAKEHDEEDDDAEYKELKAKDDASVIDSRKSNWVIIKLPFKAQKAALVQLSFKLGVKYKGTSGDQSFEFPVKIQLGSISQWKSTPSKQ